jgi:hypothetical protein
VKPRCCVLRETARGPILESFPSLSAQNRNVARSYPFVCLKLQQNATGRRTLRKRTEKRNVILSLPSRIEMAQPLAIGFLTPAADAVRRPPPPALLPRGGPASPSRTATHPLLPRPEVAPPQPLDDGAAAAGDLRPVAARPSSSSRGCHPALDLSMGNLSKVALDSWTPWSW